MTPRRMYASTLTDNCNGIASPWLSRLGCKAGRRSLYSGRRVLVLSDNGSVSEFDGLGVCVPDLGSVLDGRGATLSEVEENSARRLCFTAYKTAINTRTTASVSALSAPVLLSLGSLELTRKYLVKFLTLVITVVSWFRPVQNLS